MAGEFISIAYADPPYLGCGKKYDNNHKQSRDWDRLETHIDLIIKLRSDYPDGWALSCSSPSLHKLLRYCPEDCRVSAWVKPFAVFKPNVGVAYAWEPVIWRGGRKRTRQQPTVRDWVSANITLKRGLTGVKPDAFSLWLFELFNMRRGDTFADLFPGSGAVSKTWETAYGA